MDPLLVWLNILVLTVVFIAIIVTLLMISARRRSEIMTTQPLLMIDKVQWEEDNRGKYMMFRIENKKITHFILKKCM